MLNPTWSKRESSLRICFFEAKKPTLLAAANKAGIAGGVRQIHLTVTFQDENGHKVALPGDFYEAEISVSLILSNRWMGENHLLLEPGSNCILQRRGRKLRTLLPIGCSTCHHIVDDRQGCSRVSAGQRRRHGKRRRRLHRTHWCDNTCDFLLSSQEDDLLDFCAFTNQVQEFLPPLFVQGEWCEKDSPLDPEEMAQVAEILASLSLHATRAEIFGLVETENPCDLPLANELREKLYADFKDTVFRDDIYPDPQPRGPHGMANIKLKPGAVPVFKRAIPCHGEKLAFLRYVWAKWKNQKKMEDPAPGEWGSPLFFVPKPPKSKEPYRPVFDYRGPN